MNLAFMNTKSISATKCFTTKITRVDKNTREMDGFKVIFHFGLSIRCVFTQSTLKVFGIWNRCHILFQVLNVLGQTCETEISSLILFRMSEGCVHSKSIPALECLSTQITGVHKNARKMNCFQVVFNFSRDLVFKWAQCATCFFCFHIFVKIILQIFGILFRAWN